MDQSKLLEELAKCFGPQVGTIKVDGEEIPVFRPAWHKDEPLEETGPVEEAEE